MYSVLHVITSSSWGGLELYVASLIEEQAKAGYRVIAYVMPGSRMEAELGRAGIPLRLASRSSHFSFADIRCIRQLLRAERISVIHSHTSRDVWPSSFAVLGTNVAHVSSVYVVAMPKRDPHHWFIYHRVDAVVSSSVYTNRRLAREYPVPSKRIHLVRYGRSLEQFVRSEAVREHVRSAFGIGPDEVAIGVIGRLDPQKGIREFAEALLYLNADIRRQVRFLVIGLREEDDREMNRWLFEFQKRPEAKGHLTVIPYQKDIVPTLNALDVLALPSYREMYSLSVLEAMAMRLPVIGTDREGTTEQIGANERGLLIEPYSPAAIADAVRVYVENPALRAKHGRAGYAWVHREHAMERMLDSLGRVYSLAVDRQKGGTSRSVREAEERAAALVSVRRSPSA